MEVTIVNVIQAMLAPGIMISACGLLILGMNNKYSMVVNRIRALDEEMRKMEAKARLQPLDNDELIRCDSINLQTDKFRYRVKLVRNAVVFYSTAVAFFIVTSMIIGLQFAVEMKELQAASVLVFLTGMTCVLVGVLFAAREVWKGYQIIKIEIAKTYTHVRDQVPTS